MSWVNPVNARAWQEKGSVGSNISRRVTVWGVDPTFPRGALTMCIGGSGELYQVMRGSHLGDVQPQVGETWLIDRTMGLWTFVARLAVPSPPVQTLTYSAGGSYAMVSSNRFVFVNVALNGSFTISLPPPLDAVQGELYGVRNLNTSTTGTSTLTVAPYANETIYGATTYSNRNGGTYITDGTDWYGVAPASY